MANMEELDPQAIRNTLNTWHWLTVMAQDKANHPTLAAEIREAKAYMERDLWKKAAEQLGKPNLQAVPDGETNEG